MNAAAAPVITETLLHAWETLHGAAALDRSIGLLTAVWPELDDAHWRRVSIGDRDGCLFLLQESLFGGELQTVAACPACGERLESRFSVRDVCTPPTQLPQPRPPLQLDCEGYRVHYRLPCSEDMQTLPANASTAAAVDALLQRCIIDVRSQRDDERRTAENHAAEDRATQDQAAEDAADPTIDSRSMTIQRVSPAIRAQLCEAMAEQDPVADLQMAVVCPACAHRWSTAMDIASYLWDELDDWAQDLLAEVHVLAQHYAWSERDILAMTPVRRRFYLDLVQA